MNTFFFSPKHCYRPEEKVREARGSIPNGNEEKGRGRQEWCMYLCRDQEQPKKKNMATERGKGAGRANGLFNVTKLHEKTQFWGGLEDLRRRRVRR